MRAFLLGVATLAFAACGSSDEGPIPDPVDETDDTDPPTPEESSRDYDELATIIGAHLRGEHALQLNAAAISEMRMPANFMLTGQNGLEYTGAGTDGAMSYSFVFYCNDGTQMHVQVPCDGNAHHSHIKLTATGAIAVGDMQMDQINRTVDWEIRDLMMDKARFRGPDTVELKTSVTTNGELATYGVKFAAVYEQVRFAPAALVPGTGTIDFQLNVERMRASDRRVFNALAKVTYGERGVPTTLVIDNMHNYTIDLVSGAIVKL